ncbi:glycan metabolism protein RagB [Niabella ginsenosidivorans]|uniref:Glycan metabolism protein RagB n=1 Tax=Niabella ginsenosidivorans TaxID=1176587 RepID=A0A1A9HYX6_9BACT|nr:RagB/SusD family nutrient uptake outer membrane protein [Niabella ginsenosidivorans]ANH79999.1 glycan metabolism protein RagB [Niabella ginsenosidivorans]
MKKYVIACLLLLMLFSNESCRKQLDRVPPDSFSSENFWSSPDNVFQALTGVYRGNIQMLTPPDADAEYNPTDWWSYHGLLLIEFASDNAYDRRGDNSAWNTLTNGALTNNNANIAACWKFSYAKIARCNYFLENIGKASLDAALAARYIAEVRFIRACQYFYLSQYFGSVPLVTKTLNTQEANTVTKASHADIINFLIQEYTEAAAALPRYGALTAGERGRASAQVALAFLGRTYLAEQKWADAAAAYKQIIDWNENSIDPNYTSLFDGSNETSKEIIFATQYQQDLAPNSMLLHCYPRGLGGYHLYNPLGSLVESYEFNDGTPFSYSDSRYNPSDLGQNRDPRLKYSIVYTNQVFKNYLYDSNPDHLTSLDRVSTTLQATRTGFCPRKFNSETFNGALANSGIDLPIIRYAEVLLSYLEAKLENGDAMDQALLDATINLVRGRTSVNMPKVTETDPAKLRVILRRERRVELAMEGIRLWDLLRWKIAGDVLQGNFYGHPYPGAANLNTPSGMAADPYSRWYVTKKAFRKGQDELWPVPLSEVNINPNLK